ncbi:nitroreductase family deazaflavin-dependent oxidoreductase [Aldersonia sp. NBC_00410]|uniref:nitroreductase family deazaflavin-dependent oxidoreductase n=1 Tax=Aldersonia sp. NBC_00410 TaxID=2975954 RepID=UPI00225A0FAE|nr:nitroreductase family deazaflavin-dependent oxidoreductase [Aldersonia sp. NBC_00410]MCX5043290.1 nitroreductase family deazaflavin-dependent oxidoreductase [Aldersonia sp. NBC_00410]
MTSAAPKGLDSPKAVKIIKIMSQVNTRLYRATGGRLGSKWRVGSAFPWGVPVLLLTTIGRKTSEKRISPLLFIQDGPRVVVVASQGGLPKNPAWFYNIRSNPNVTVQIKSNVRQMTAHVADAEERAEVWPKLVAMYPDFDKYQSWTDRQIPVVICE